MNRRAFIRNIAGGVAGVLGLGAAVKAVGGIDATIPHPLYYSTSCKRKNVFQGEYLIDWEASVTDEKIVKAIYKARARHAQELSRKWD